MVEAVNPGALDNDKPIGIHIAEGIMPAEIMTMEQVYTRMAWGAQASLRVVRLIRQYEPERLDRYLLEAGDGPLHEHISLRCVLRSKDGADSYEAYHDSCQLRIGEFRWLMTYVFRKQSDIQLIDIEVLVGGKWHSLKAFSSKTANKEVDLG